MVEKTNKWKEEIREGREGKGRGGVGRGGEGRGGEGRNPLSFIQSYLETTKLTQALFLPKN